MSGEPTAETKKVPKYEGLIWLAMPDGSFQATFDERLKLMVGGMILVGTPRYLSMVLLAGSSQTVAIAFYASEADQSRRLAYKLALAIMGDFV